MAGKIYRTSIGAVRVTALQDSWTRILAARMVLPEIETDFAPYAHLLDADGLIELSLHTFLLESQGRRILVDSCLGDQKMPRSELGIEPCLLDTMAEAGLAPEDIDVVVHTHLHFDHVGWNTRYEGNQLVPTFPNARHVIQRVDWDYWTPEPLFPGGDYARYLRPLEDAGMVDLIEADDHALTDEVSVIHARGHTPGHQAVRITSGGEAGYVIGDACHIPMQACEPHWSSGADSDPDLAARTRAALFQRIEDEDALILSGHFPFPGVGRRVTSDGRRMYVPLGG
jgi:glyoxylase-like metal-dependent hydrolase (beta-lactamase superfamily II)